MLHLVTRFVDETESSLRKLYDSLLPVLGREVKWYLVGKGSTTILDGLPAIRIESPTKPDNDWGLLINLYLDCVPASGQWVYFLDGDNLLHPNLISHFTSLDSKIGMVVMDQEVSSGNLRKVLPENLVVQKVDIGQVIFSRAFIGELRAWSVYRNDGYLIQELAIRAREYGWGVKFVNQTSAYYNRQKWKTV